MNQFCLIILLVFIFALTTVNGQNKIVGNDSLSMILNKLNPVGKSFADDTTRINILCQTALKLENLSEQEKTIALASVVSGKIPWRKGEYLVEFTRGLIYNKSGAYLKAINALFKALYTAESMHRPSLQADCLQVIGDAYAMLKQFELATKHYRRALYIFKKLGKIVNYIDCLNNFSLVYYDQKNYREALRLLAECVKNGEFVKGTIYEASYLSNIASVYRNMGKLDSAIYYFDRTLEVYELNKGKYNNWLAITLVEKARVYEMQNNFTEAINLASEAYKMNSKYFGNNLYVTELLSNLYSKTGNFENAYKFNKEYFQEWDKAQLQDRTKQVEALKFEYENKKNKAEITLLNKDNLQKSLQRRVLAAGVIFLLFCLIASIWNFQILRKKNIKIEMQREELARVSTELESINSTLEQQVEFRTIALTEANNELTRKNKEIEEALYRGQNTERKRVASELHDNLGSTISGLIWQLDGMAMENEQPEYQTTYHHLIDKMREAYSEIRYISHNLYPAELEKNGLSDSLQRLVNSLNRNARIVFTFEHNESIDSLPKQLQLELYSIAMELLNNVIKHSGAKVSAIVLNNESGKVKLSVSDDGIGINPDQNINAGSGLKNIFARVDAIGGEVKIIREDIYNQVLVTV